MEGTGKGGKNTDLVVDDDVRSCTETASRSETIGDGTDEHVDFRSL